MKRIISLMLAVIMVVSIVLSVNMTASAAGNSIPTATPIEFDKKVSGTITQTNTKDVYSVYLGESGHIDINVLASIEAIGFYVYNELGETIWYDSWIYWNSTTQLTTLNLAFDLTKGTYYFAIEKEDGTGSYNCKVTFEGADETFSEPQGGNNNSLVDADSVSFKKTYKGQLASNDNKDLYTFTLSQASNLNINVSAYIKAVGCYLYDEEGNTLWYDSWMYWNETSQVNKFDLNFDLTKGTYYFAIEKEDGTGNYNFKVTYKSADVSINEPQGGDNNMLTQADSISLSKSYKGQIALNDDKDFYKFNTKKSSNVTISLTAYIPRSNYYLYDKDGNEIWKKEYCYWNDTSKEFVLNEILTLDAGIYYFAVSKYYGETGNYKFNIKCSHKWKNNSLTKATQKASGKADRTCTVCGKKVSETIYKISSIKLSTTSYTYNGKEKTPSVVVKDSKGNKLKKNTDYTVKYNTSCKYVGKHSVKVTFKGDYSGSKTLYFTIKPQKTSVASVTAGKKSFTAKWYKNTSQTTGYEIQYSTSSSFKGAATKNISSYKTTSTTVKSLSSAKTYYVRVRTYKTVKGVKYYSSWSSAKKVKTK